MQRALKDAIEHIFDRPGEVADGARVDHAATALERMKRTPDDQQRIAVERIVIPDRKLLLDLRHFLLRFLDEQLDQVRIRERRGMRRSHVGRGAE